MGDHTNLQITIYDCPADEVDAVCSLLEEYGLFEGTFDCGYPTHDHLTLGVQYGAWEASCGSSDEIASALMEAAPGASWEVWEDPRYEWLGSLNRYTPELGHFGAECDADGQPQFTPDLIVDKLKSVDPDTRVGDLDIQSWLGEPWQEALGALGAKKYTTLPRLQDPCTECREEEAEDHGMCASCLHNALRSGWTPGAETS